MRRQEAGADAPDLLLDHVGDLSGLLFRSWGEKMECLGEPGLPLLLEPEYESHLEGGLEELGEETGPEMEETCEQKPRSKYDKDGHFGFQTLRWDSMTEGVYGPCVVYASMRRSRIPLLL